ncbi:MAG: helix-turn-helix transcriptional regulator, partial [Clostridia bacterium]|nr:helix-turn-helix transcriptional regulator [Clostridia bacterium]
VEALPTDNLFEYAVENKFPESFWEQKSFVYSVIAAFEKNREYHPRTKGQDVLLEMLLLTETLYTSECNLSIIANKLGYDYAYLSKLFKRKVGIPFNTYLNLLKINNAKNLILTTEKSITEISVLCGFESLRTFNRVFLSFVGINPTQFRKNLK